MDNQEREAGMGHVDGPSNILGWSIYSYLYRLSKYSCGAIGFKYIRHIACDQRYLAGFLTKPPNLAVSYKVHGIFHTGRKAQ